MEKSTRRELIKVSGVLGIALIVFMLLGTGISLLVRRIYAAEILPKTLTVECLFQVLYTILAILLPFSLCRIWVEHIQGRARGSLIPFQKPKNAALFWCALGVGFMACMLSNLFTSWFVVSMENAGFTFDSASFGTPTTAGGYFWSILADAFVPALCEEYALRGVVLQSLRKYGESMAIGISSLLFALMHGNATQAPFAFLLGIVIGRLAIATDSLWTGIAIHFLNNTYAVVMSALNDKGNTMNTAVVVVLVYTVSIAIGLMCIVLLRTGYRWRDREVLQNPGETAQEKRVNRWRAELYTILSLPMFISLVLLFHAVFATVSRG